MKNLTIGLAVRNEEKCLELCINSINNSIKKIKNPLRIIICLNGCTDQSLEVSIYCQKKYSNLNIKIIKSSKGKLNAQEKILKYTDSNSYILFIDSDCQINTNSIKILINELNRHKQLLLVGGYPKALKYNGGNIWKKFLDNILNIRSRNPKCELSKYNVKEYHKYALTDPQTINTNENHELISKIFIHGRMFILRDKKYWFRPSKKSGAIGDDSFLPDYILYSFGKDKIRIRYDAVVNYIPYVSIITHYYTYKRIHFDLKILGLAYPELKEIRHHSKLILDKDYIRHQTFPTRFNFLIYRLIRFIEKRLYIIALQRDPKIIWSSHK